MNKVKQDEKNQELLQKTAKMIRELNELGREIEAYLERRKWRGKPGLFDALADDEENEL